MSEGPGPEAERSHKKTFGGEEDPGREAGGLNNSNGWGGRGVLSESEHFQGCLGGLGG